MCDIVWPGCFRQLPNMLLLRSDKKIPHDHFINSNYEVLKWWFMQTQTHTKQFLGFSKLVSSCNLGQKKSIFFSVSNVLGRFFHVSGEQKAPFSEKNRYNNKEQQRSYHWTSQNLKIHGNLRGPTPRPTPPGCFFPPPSGKFIATFFQA